MRIYGILKDSKGNPFRKSFFSNSKLILAGNYRGGEKNVTEFNKPDVDNLQDSVL